jgi:hypothetical protein
VETELIEAISTATLFERSLTVFSTLLSKGCMKVLVFSSDTALFYKKDGAWTAQPVEAFDFDDIREAARFCREKELPGARIVLEFEDGQAPLTVPAALIQRADQKKSLTDNR